MSKSLLGPVNSIDPLYEIKGSLTTIFNRYICWWKFSLFGHHHNERATAVLRALHHCDNLIQMEEIISNQLDLFYIMDNIPTPTPLLDERWSGGPHIINWSYGQHSSGYLEVISQAKSALAAYVQFAEDLEPEQVFTQ